MLGHFEDGDPVGHQIRKFIQTDSAVICPGFVSDTAPYYQLMSVMVLPTYREGLGMVSLEAQASGIPVVTTMATGAIDSVIEGVTGLKVPVADSASLAAAIETLLDNQVLRSRMGHAGRKWVETNFRPEVVWQEHVRLYRDLLNEKLETAPFKFKNALARSGKTHICP
jgi:glycosyltransferase involved in cell wall biosynthesis